MKKGTFKTLFFLGLILFNNPIMSQFTQQGQKLVGTGAVGTSQQGFAVSVSGDGNTAIVGGGFDNKIGASWIYTRSTGVWTQQGPKLVNTLVHPSWQGYSVAISADGNTAIVGDVYDDNAIGAARIYSRQGGVWSQQGVKLVDGGAESNNIYQGASVAISSDGNTVIVGGYGDNNINGAAWVYTRSGTVWTQQGEKLVGTGVVGTTGAGQGISVSLSSDGSTAIVGGYYDNSNTGAAWVYTRDGGVWTQQGEKLVGTGAIGKAKQGISVSLSSDGNTAVVGGNSDNTAIGAVWIFTRSGGVWSQLGPKLVGTGVLGIASQGSTVSISSDGNTAAVGGYRDNNDIGATWIFTRSGDQWTQMGSKLVGTGAAGKARQGTSVSISSDGNTVIAGGYYDNGQIGAAWIFTRSEVLSVNFISINANSSSDGILVNWKVAEEKEILRYEVERSLNGQSFFKEGSVTANGGSSYNWIDVLPLAGNAFYRVKSIGLSGEIKYSGIVKIVSAKEQSMFTLSPNPVIGNELKVLFKNQPKGLYGIQLTDASGRMVLKTSVLHSGGSSTQTINLPVVISNGSYQLRIIATGKTFIVKQVLVNRSK